jgi:hypothetical protein
MVKVAFQQSLVLVADVHQQTAFMFGTVWAVWAVKLRFLATFQSHMPQHALLI